MKQVITLLSIILLISACSQEETTTEQENAPKLSTYETLPTGWRSEIIPFPFEFAPNIRLDGVEEIIFMPGMYKPETDDFFSYAFAWKVQQSTLSNDQIQSYLHAYYSGLYKAVSEKESSDVKVTIEEITDAWPLRGNIEWTEPFVTKQAQKLSYKAKKVSCEDANETRWYFIASPQPASHGVWSSLEGLALTNC